MGRIIFTVIPCNYQLTTAGVSDKTVTKYLAIKLEDEKHNLDHFCDVEIMNQCSVYIQFSFE